MFSILIPTYNYVCLDLVEALHRQAEALKRSQPDAPDVEIIVGDDGSTDPATVAANRRIEAWPGCRLWTAGQNIGRAALRNRLAEQAVYPYLIFIDSDAVVEHDDFLLRYYRAVTLAPVVAGGLYHPLRLPTPDVTLRYRYERNADRRRSAVWRARYPYGSFTAFNLLVRRDVIRAVPFDEKCRHYGYEDVLLGRTLERRGVPVAHIDNPLLHTGLDTNVAFLNKSETALRTLHALGLDLQRTVPLSAWALRLQRWRLAELLRCGHRLWGDALRRHLSGTHPLLPLFALYRLGYYLCLSAPDAPETEG